MRAYHGESILSASDSDADLSVTEGSSPGLDVSTRSVVYLASGRASFAGSSARAGAAGACAGDEDRWRESPLSGGGSFVEDAAVTLRELRDLVRADGSISTSRLVLYVLVANHQLLSTTELNPHSRPDVVWLFGVTGRI